MLNKEQKDYKRFLYAGKAANTYFRLALYGSGSRYSVMPDNSLTWAQTHKKSSFVPHEQRPGFVGFIYQGAMTIALTAPGEYVKGLPSIELRKRLYTLISVGGEGDNRAQFKLASAAGMKKDLGKLASDFSLAKPPPLMRMAPNKYLSLMLFEESISR